MMVSSMVTPVVISRSVTIVRISFRECLRIGSSRVASIPLRMRVEVEALLSLCRRTPRGGMPKEVETNEQWCRRTPYRKCK